MYDAKGIETVRRDGIPATVKMLEKSIRILFETKDLSEVKQYVQNQFRKLQAGSVCIRDLTFAKEFRGLRGYRPTACVPALELTRQAMRVDRRAVPRVGEVSHDQDTSAAMISNTCRGFHTWWCTASPGCR